MSSVHLKTYAKINLSLDVIGVRADGYHDVSMVMQAIDLSDDLTVDVIQAAQSRIILTMDNPEIPTDEQNTAYQAASAMMDLYEGGPVEVHIDIVKRIPAAAGLAGGSSDAAGVILALNSLLGTGFSLSQMCAIGQRIGADVPFCVMSSAACQQQIFPLKGSASCALAEGIGEILTPLRSVLFYVVLAKPSASVSTAQVYRKLDGIEIKKRPETSHLIEGISTGNIPMIQSAMCNVLENVTFRLCPEAERLKELMSVKGSVCTMMSGSGPTVFSLFRSQEKAAALASSLYRLEEQGYRVFLTKTM